MKKITEETVIRLGQEVYNPVVIDGVIYWVDKNNYGELDDYVTNGSVIIQAYFLEEHNRNKYSKIVAQSEYEILEDISVPVIAQSMIRDHGFDMYEYTIEDIEKAFDAGAAYATGSHEEFQQIHISKSQFIERLNSVKEIVVDEDFNPIYIK